MVDFIQRLFANGERFNLTSWKRFNFPLKLLLNKYILIHYTETEPLVSPWTPPIFIRESVNWIWVSFGDWQTFYGGWNWSHAIINGLNPLVLLGQPQDRPIMVHGGFADMYLEQKASLQVSQRTEICTIEMCCLLCAYAWLPVLLPYKLIESHRTHRYISKRQRRCPINPTV